MWGKWSVERIPLAIFSAIGSFTLMPVEMMKREAGEDFSASVVLFCLSLGAFLLLMGVSARRLMLSYSRKAPGIHQVLWLLACYALYWPFIIWWDPYETKWFVVPNLFLTAAIAKLWSLVPSARQGLLWACVAVIASANFLTVIWPRHAVPNPDIEIAACLAARLHSSDLLIALSWNQYDYAAYFDSSDIQAISVIRTGSTLNDRLELIERTVSETHQQGSHVYMKAADDHSPLESETLRFVAGLAPQDFSRLAQRPAFTCGGKQFVEVLERLR